MKTTRHDTFDHNLMSHVSLLQVDMPVFFYIDPEFTEDPWMENVDVITLSYTFFESRPGLQLPSPPTYEATGQVPLPKT